MKKIFILIILISSLFGLEQKEYMMNSIKSLIQKEEYLALAVNKYILQTGKFPIKDQKIDIELLKKNKYLDTNFNDINPYTNKKLETKIDNKNNTFIKGIETFKEGHEYLYNFYSDSKFRVNTIPPANIKKESLKIDTQVLYNKTQQDIQKLTNEIEANSSDKEILLSTENCSAGAYFYELSNEKLVYKYCKAAKVSFNVYQNGPIFLEDIDDLNRIIVNQGEKAYVKDGLQYAEYYFEGDGGWISVGTGETTKQVNNDLTFEDRVLNYIPKAKDLVLKQDGGCMLANGDIFCFGNNINKKAGIENYGQLDTSITVDYVNTPVMLKVQIEDIKIDDTLESSTVLKLKEKNWFNNPYRIKFEKMAMNNESVCGVSPIFENFSKGIRYKRGGDLYCNGALSETYFDTIVIKEKKIKSILRRNKQIAEKKSTGVYDKDAIYLKDIVMVNGTIVVLSDMGDLYSVGSNDKGARGIKVPLNANSFQKINHPEEKLFKKVFALRDIKGFGALDDDNHFYIWGERPNGTIYDSPYILSNSSRFYEDSVFVNSKEFILKAFDNKYYRTYGDASLTKLDVENALSVSVYDYKGKQYLLYVDENMELNGSENLLKCKNPNFSDCDTTDENIFAAALNELNNVNNMVNNKAYATFSNVSIFQSLEDGLSTDVNYGTDSFEDFEGNSPNTSVWNKTEVYKISGGSSTSQFLGPFGGKAKNNNNSNNNITTDGTQQVKKTYQFKDLKSQNVKLSFDMYEIGSWDSNVTNNLPEKFFVYVNDQVVRSDMYGNVLNETKSGTNLSPINVRNQNLNVRKHHYDFAIKLDKDGKVTLGFGANLNEDFLNESFGIDNIRISKKIDNATFANDEYKEDFKNGQYDYWIVPEGIEKKNNPYEFYPIFDTGAVASKILGRFGRLVENKKTYFGGNDGTERVYKIFSFGKDNGNKTVTIDFDFYRIDDWSEKATDKESLKIFINGTEEIIYDPSKHSNYNSQEINIGNTKSTKDYKISLKRENIKLDEYGNVQIGFGSFNVSNTRNIDNLSWGIDNIKIKLKQEDQGGGIGGVTTNKMPYVCAMTGLGSKSQMYCWGNTDKSLPILSTSLYDVSKIDSINKLFVTQTSDLGKQMTFEKFNNNGKLFLRYPTYIGGFDYPFYFK